MSAIAAPTLAAQRLAMLQMLGVALFWGMFFVFGKLAVAESTPMAAAALRFIVAGVVLVALLAWREPGALWPKRQDWGLALALAATGVAAYNGLTFMGFLWAPASDGAMLNPTVNPVLTAFLAAWLMHEPLHKHKLTGLALAVVGIALIFVGPILLANAGGGRWIGDAFFIGASVVWSVYTLLGKHAVGRFSPLASTTYASVLGALMLVPLAWGDFTRLDWGGLSVAFWVSIAGMALLSTIAAFLLWHSAIRVLGASRTASFHLLVPIVGVALGVLWLGDRPGPLQWAGMALTIAGVYWANRPASAD